MKKQFSTKKALMLSVLSLCLCCAMLIGTTFAWFTDSVTSKGNIIQTGTLDVEMYWANADKDVAAVTDWADASTGAMFKETTLWEPGYVEAKHIKINNVGSLALNYKLRIVANGVVSKLADVIDVYYVKDATAAVTRDNLGTKLGTLADVLGTDNNLAKTIRGSLLAGKTATWSLVLKMQESAGNEYQNLAIGTDFSVELIATQMSYEKDSFDEKYDDATIVPNPELPAALVRPLENLTIDTTGSKMGEDLGEFTLSAGYKFEPTASYEDAVNSDQRYWHADFVVSADRDVPANSIVLAGYYDAWCSLNNDKWVALTSPVTVTTGTEVRLVANMAGGFFVNWEELCNYGNDGIGFQCGIGAINGDALKALSGTTVTVELNVYETYTEEEAIEKFGNNSTNYEKADYEANPEDYITTVGTFTYTFPVAEAATTEELNAALDAGAKEVEVAAGTYTFPASKLTAGTTLYCEEGTVFEGSNQLNTNGATVVGATFDASNNGNFNTGAGTSTVNGIYKDCVFTGNNGLRYCYAGDTVVFENCVFDGDTYGAHFDGGANDVTFKNCTFSGFNTFGSAITKLTLEGCTFVANGRSAYNGVNLWGNSELTNCTFVFDGSASYEWVDLVSDNQTVTFTGCVVSDGTTERALTASDVGDYGTGNTITVK